MPPVPVHPLRQYRAANGFTRPQLAHLLGCAPKTLARWEAGQFRPRLPLALRVQQVTGLPVALLVRPALSIR